MVQRFFETLFPVREGEKRLTLALFLHSFFAVGAFLAARTVRDALFLAHNDRGQLAWMYIASAVAVTLVGLAYGPLSAQVRRDRMALWTASVFAAIFAVAYVLERGEPSWIYPALYVYVEAMGALVLVQFWTLANELYNAREAKRLYGLIGSGGTVANILVGYAAARIATHFGASAMLLLCTGLLLGTALSSFSAGRFGRQRLFAKAASGRSAPKREGGAGKVFSSSHLRMVAALAAITFFTTTLVDFEFKVVASQAFEKDQLAAFFGYFSVGVGLLALGLQLFGTSRLLNRAGVVICLALLPAFLGLGSLAMAIFPVLWAASALKGSDTLFRYSVNDPTTQLLYLPVGPQARAAAKAFIDGVVKPISIGLCGVALVVYKATVGASLLPLALAGLALCGGWLAIVARLRHGYLRSLQDNLRNRKLDLASARHKVVDGSTNQVLERALQSADPREILNALELLPHLENVQLDQRVEALLGHELPHIRIAALEYYARRQTMRFANSIFRKFEDPDPKVRAAAIDAFCAIGKDKSVRSVRPFLSDADPSVRAAAVTGMIRYGGLDGVLVAAEALKALIDHPDAVMRLHAAKVLGAIGVTNFYQPVLNLMNDEDPAVRRQAIRAAAVLKSPEFVIPLIYKTQSIETLHEAVDALTLFGNAIIPTLAKVLGNHLEDPQIRRAVARVLGRLATTESVNVITHHLGEPDEELRARMYKSLARAVRGRRLALADPKPVNDALMRELERAFETLYQAELLGLGAGPGPDTPLRGEPAARALLASALQEKVAQAERRIFLLLAVLYPDADMEQIYAGIHDATALDAPRRRANATELLDNLLPRNVKRRFLPLLEELPRAKKLELVVEMYAPRPRDARTVLTELARDETAWVRACAVWCLSQLEAPAAATELADLLASSTADQNAVVRESALVALARAAPMRAREIAESRLRDEAPVVRRQAAIITTTLLQPAGAEAPTVH